MKQNMSSIEIRSKFLEFFGNNGHTIVPSSSLIPKDDDSVLFTTAGMQQFKDYYTDKKDAQSDFHSKNTASIQKCIRTSDIDEVGDSSHLTFFEMFGNFSFGGYYKENAIKYAYEFITREMALDISYITVFKGLENSPIKKDEESIKVWKSLGIKDIREEGMEDVFWGPTGSSGPCGPTTEIYCKDNKGKDLEIWNIVFNEFYCYGSREQLLESPQTVRLESLSFKGIDTGMGLERLVMIIQKVDNIYDTDIFKSAMNKIKENSDKWDIKGARIIADHIRASTSLIEDGVIPSNTDRGY
ncbi:MAG TPA: alanine--tRNA ligase-related protein, partial [Candidatus Paceibacterota bacterium]